METNFKVDMPSFALGYSAGKKKGGGGTPEGFHMVRFFNDDQTTLLYTVFVPTGANAMYAGETPVSAEGGVMFRGFDPSAVNVTADLDCYAVYEHAGTLNEESWQRISELSAEGLAENIFAIGDTKMIHIEGTVGTLEVNGDYGVYIIGFDHNEELEGKGIHFGTFKKADGKDLCMASTNTYLQKDTSGLKWFNMNHWGAYNLGGWSRCDLRYDILGSTDVAPLNYGSRATSGDTGYDATETCATNPVANTLMAALPHDLRAVMKPMTKYTDNFGGNTNVESWDGHVTATIDYLPLLSTFEVHGKLYLSNGSEAAVQKQYKYFADGRSAKKYTSYNADQVAYWFSRSPRVQVITTFCDNHISGGPSNRLADVSCGLAPIFKV
ncbi:MAG: hypothetical protein IIV80_02650 [Clostridia bacterium]|nr:hypothetical protein [Clostridia bacterium]